MKRKRISKILDLKGYQKELLEIEVRRCLEELESEALRLEKLEETFEQTAEEFNGRQQEGGMSIQELELFYNYLLHIKTRVGRQKEVVMKKLADLERKKGAVIEAYREQRVFEILHEKLRQEEVRAIDICEQKSMDYQFLCRRLNQ